MLNDVVNAFTFPFTDKKWPIKILIGGLFCIGNFFIMGFSWGRWYGLVFGLILIALLIWFPMGYMLRIIRDAIEGKPASMPEWTDWEKLMKDGIAVFCIWIVYSIIFYVISFILGAIMSSIKVLYPILSLLNLVIVALLLAIPNLMLITVCKFAKEKDLKVVLDFKAIFDEFKKNLGSYIILVLLFIGVKTVVFIIQGHFLNFFLRDSFPIVSLLIPFISFYMLLVVGRLYGLVYGGGTKKEVSPAASSTKKSSGKSAK